MDNKIQTIGNKQGITRNTVVGDVEIAEAGGNLINRDLGKANEVTKDTHSTNINVEPQVIEYLTNPGKLKEDIGKAKEKIMYQDQIIFQKEIPKAIMTTYRKV